MRLSSWTSPRRDRREQVLTVETAYSTNKKFVGLARYLNISCKTASMKRFPKAAIGQMNMILKADNLLRFHHTVSSSCKTPVHVICSGFC
jgi:hypothetical protein